MSSPSNRIGDSVSRSRTTSVSDVTTSASQSPTASLETARLSSQSLPSSTQNANSFAAVKTISSPSPTKPTVARSTKYYPRESDGYHGGRKKRGILTLVIVGAVCRLISAGAAALAIWNRKDVNDLKKDVEYLMEQQRIRDQESVALRDSFLGLTNFSGYLTNKTASGIDQINLMQQLFGQKLLETSGEINLINSRDQVANSMLLMLIEQLNLIDRMNGVVASLKDRCDDFKLGMTQLNNNILSTNFVPYHKLRQILLEIRANLAPEYNLGIDLRDIDRYYTARLVTYDKTKDFLIIRLVVPLSLREFTPAKPFELFLPVFSPYPCGPTDPRFCRIGENSEFITIQEDYFREVSPKKFMSCDYSGNLVSRIQIGQQVHSYASNCTLALMHSKFEDIESSCYIVATHHPYHPIRIDGGVYGIHGTSELIYDRMCNSEPDRILIAKDRPYSIEHIPKGCSLLMNGKSYPGAVREGSKNFKFELPAKNFVPSNFRTSNSLSINFDVKPFAEFNVSSIEYSKMDIDETILSVYLPLYFSPSSFH